MYKSHRRRTPSLSSSLVDSIYRSIDEPNRHEEEDEESSVYRRKITVKESSISTVKLDSEDRKRSNLKRSVMIESWTEKRRNHGSAAYNSTSSSSDSSSGVLFSSSEAESSHFHRKKSSIATQRILFEHRNSDKKQKPKLEGRFTKTKLRALKIYGELKKVKHPTSPGCRIASFLNSIFNSTGSAKKVNMCSVGAMKDVSFDDRKPKSACSATTSFSRPCLSNTVSSRRNSGIKRSVRFYPVSVIVDEDCRTCDHKSIYEDDPSLMTFPSLQKIVKSSSVKEELNKGSGSDYLTSYQKKNENEFDLRRFGNFIEDDSDAESYSSSDLVELDHLIGIGWYREELPVYETTNLKTNQAIANGFIL